MNANAMMAAGWLLHTAAGGGLILLVTWGLMARTRQPALRQRLGEIGLVAGLALALLNLGPRWLLISWPPTEVRAVERKAEPLVLDPPGSFEVEEPLPIGEARAEVSGPAAPGTLERLQEFGPWALLAYALGAGLLLSRWLLGHVALARLLHVAPPAPPQVVEIFREAVGRRAPPRLLMSACLRAPVSCGVLRPTVVLPVELCVAPDAARLRWVFAHELTHLERYDAWSCLLFGLGQTAFFYIPWFWPVRRQVRLCQEFLADAAAAGQGRVADYAEFLLSLTGTPTAPLGATGVSGPSSDLYRRVTMLLQDPLHVEPRCSRRLLVAAAGCLLCLAVLLAGVGVRADAQSTIIILTDGAPPAPKPPVPPAPPVPPMPPAPGAKAEEKALQFLRYKLVLNESASTDRKAVTVGPGGAILAEKLPGAMVNSPVEQHKAAQDALQRAIQQLQKNLDQVQQQNLDRAQVEKARAEIERALQALNASLAAGQAQAAKAQADRGRVLMNFVADKAHTPRLGISVDVPSRLISEQLGLVEGQGLVIREVLKGTSAEKAGLKANDILLELNGKPVSSDPGVFMKEVWSLKEGPVTALILRKGKREEIKGVLPAPPAGHEVRVWDAGPFKYKALFAPLVVDVEPPPGQPKVPGAPLPAKGAVTTTRTRTVEQFTTRYQEGKLSITVTGSVEGDKMLRVFEVAIQNDGGSVLKYNGVEAVPEQYRERVRQLVDTMRETGKIR
jgi:hypothetical protein